MMLVVLPAAMSIGFSSCNKEDKSVVDDSWRIMGKWYNYHPEGYLDTRYFLEFKADGTYSYVTPNENINGDYKIVERQELSLLISEEFNIVVDAIQYKLLASGSSAFDELWLYNYYYSKSPGLLVHLYAKKELVQELRGFSRNE